MQYEEKRRDTVLHAMQLKDLDLGFFLDLVKMWAPGLLGANRVSKRKAPNNSRESARLVPRGWTWFRGVHLPDFFEYRLSKRHCQV